MKTYFQLLVTGLLVVAILVSSVLANGTTTQAASDDCTGSNRENIEAYHSLNDIVLYDKCACTVVATQATGFTMPTTGDMAYKLFTFFTTTSFSGMGNKPFSALQAAGAIGNFVQESGLKTDAIEISTGEGYGLAQWSYGRKATLLTLLS